MRMLSFENQLHITSNFQFSVTFPFQTTTELSSTVHTPTCTAAVRRHTTQYSAACQRIMFIPEMVDSDNSNVFGSEWFEFLTHL